MKAVLLLTIFVALAVARTENEYRSMWSEFKNKYQKSYESSVMETTRYEIFKMNVDFIDNHNAGNHAYTVAINSFADMTNEEFRAVYLGTRMPTHRRQHNHLFKANPNATLPASVDWVKAGAVTHIKNQGQCGSCWSFSTTGSVEGCVAVESKKSPYTLVCLSEQNLVDCSTAQGNEGCDGGLMDDAFQYIIQNGGIDSESSYPYTAEDGTCSYTKASDTATITSYKDITSGSESDLEAAVAQQPVSVAIDASQSSFQFYSGGVYSDPNCSTSQLDHGVLAVGYGTSSGTAYWYVKNSWGTDWGMNGYIWMARNDGNMCGIATAASFPTGCKALKPTGTGC